MRSRFLAELAWDSRGWGLIAVPIFALIKAALTLFGSPYRHRYLLCAEGISYFLLALMEFLTHTIPVLYQDLSTFKLVDIILGI